MEQAIGYRPAVFSLESSVFNGSLSASDHSGRFSGRIPGEDCGQVARTEVAGEDFSEEVSEVGGDRDVSPFIPCLGAESGPGSRHLLAGHRAAEHEHRGAVTVIGAAGSILPDGAAELRHRQHADIAHPLAEIGREGSERLSKLGQAERELALIVALIHVGIPTAHVREGDLEAESGLDELGDLLKALTQLAAGIDRSIFRTPRGRVGRP